MTKKNSILIVDDIQSNLILLNKILTDEGYFVVSASNGDEAIKFAKENTFDLILLDIMMPKKDGFTVFEELKQDESTAKVPVIFITVINNDADTLKAFEIGAVDYITKPFTPTELRIRVRTQIALANAQEKGKPNLDFSNHIDNEAKEKSISLLSEKLVLIKNQILDFEHKKFNNEEKTNIEILNTQAMEIVKLLKKMT